MLFCIDIHIILLLHKDNVHWYITELETLQATGYNVCQSYFLYNRKGPVDVFTFASYNSKSILSFIFIITF